MSAMLPSKVMVPSLAPLPTIKLKPVVSGSVIRPLLPVSVTRTVPPPASTSLREIRLPLPLLKISAAS